MRPVLSERPGLKTDEPPGKVPGRDKGAYDHNMSWVTKDHRAGWGRWLAAGLGALWLMPALALGQLLPPPPGGPREVLPEIPPGTPSQPEMLLPPIPPPPEGRLSTGPKIFVREVRIVGNTVLSEAELREVVGPYVNKQLSAEELQNLRQALTIAYINRGYINSGAVLPDQTVSDGIVTYRVVEGVASAIDVTGTEHLDPDYVRNRLARSVGPPLNIKSVEERLQLLLQDPLIERLNVEVRPGLQPGEAVIGAKVGEAQRFSATAAIANNQSPSVGSERGEISGVIRNLTGWGDALSLAYGRSRGLDDGKLAFSIPITASDTILGVRYEINQSTVIEETFRPLDIESRSQTFEVSLAQPVYRTPQQSLTVGAALARRESKTFLLGEPFSFSPGVDNGRARVFVLRLSQDWLDREPDQVLAARSTFSIGLDAFDATDTGAEPNGRFFAWLGQVQYVRRIIDDTQLVARADLQLSSDPLFSLEQLSIGGVDTVRGYRQNQLVRDNGFIGSLEVRVPILRHPIPWANDETDGAVLQLAPFFDYGIGWNTDRDTPSPKQLFSLGLGLRWDLGPRLQAQLYYGYGFRHVDNPGKDDLQDQGIHFRVVSKLY